jgi:hypothetical protein
MKGNTFAISALKRLHAEFGRTMNETRREAKRITESMKQIEAVLKMLEPGFDLRAVVGHRRPKSVTPYRRGTVFRAVLDALREADHPLTSREMAEALLARAGIANPSYEQVRAMWGSIHSAIRAHQGKTIVRVGDTLPMRWRVRA